MNTKLRKQCQKGIHLIEEAILGLLYNAKKDLDEGWVRNADIHKELVMPRYEQTESHIPNPTDITRGFLEALRAKWPCSIEFKDGGFYRLTDEGYQKQKEKR